MLSTAKQLIEVGPWRTEYSRYMKEETITCPSCGFPLKVSVSYEQRSCIDKSHFAYNPILHTLEHPIKDYGLQREVLYVFCDKDFHRKTIIKESEEGTVQITDLMSCGKVAFKTILPANYKSLKEEFLKAYRECNLEQKSQ